ncbi:phage head closure protein [Roseicitreum antarcticum]|uniref:Phage head-tail adaptor, putative, SPP1 family n=1 Tax=Roseicitreum antarcticum TaxID=564137 RepID=A0A1H2WCC2_9RHOB|nr:phage head closure protein [Roseicitreum antarcticum]SDW78187.1 phage head-tail adaptor, putative, SPP1 family [Roseicitreum antarcticum]
MSAGRLNRRIQFRRGTMVSDGFGTRLEWNAAQPEADNHGTPVWAEKADISDGERWRAGEVGAQITTRFKVRYSPFTAGITPKDRIAFDGLTYNIHGIKEPPGTRRQWIELTASARNDQ